MRNFCLMFWPIVGFLLGLAILVLGAVLSFVVLPSVVRDVVVRSVVLNDPSSEQYERWEELPVPMIYRIYFFNVTNVDEVQSGDKPQVREIGPYVYRQYRNKFNIDRDTNAGTLAFYERQTFEYDLELSGGRSDLDEITVLNAPLMGILLEAEESAENDAFMILVNIGINNIFNNPSSIFLTTSVREILFTGISICAPPLNIIAQQVCDVIRSTTTSSMRPVPEDDSVLFSFFHHKNDSNDGRLVIMDGVADSSDLGRVLSWNDQSRLTIWSETDSRCNMINGTDSTIYPPFLEDTLHIDTFNVDICRSTTIHYEGEEIYSGILGRKYVSGPDMFSAELDCFCEEERGCFKDGVMDLYNCQGGHVAVSMPHFLYADEEYQNGVLGLDPIKDRHESFGLLEPYTGSPLRGAKRVQFNQLIRPVVNIAVTQNIAPTLMPIFWVEEGIDLPDEYVDYLREQLFDYLDMIDVFMWSTLIIGPIMIVLFSILAIVIYFKCLKAKKV